jgi:hypothetical protein
VGVLAALALVAGATAVGGRAGLLVALGLLAVAVAAIAYRRRAPSEPNDEHGGPPDVSSMAGRVVGTGRGDGDDHLPSLRERWRTFARWVAPTDWERRTPGEVSRSAVDDGFPREPVDRLTRLFREVEYGDRPPSRERRHRATEAFEALEAARRGDTEEGADR